MKNQFRLKNCFIFVLILALVLSTAPMAFAETATDKWAMKAPMPTQRLRFETAVIDGKIYAVGGENKNEKLTSMEVYDPATDKWETKANLNISRSAFQLKVLNGKLYAIGGSTKDSLNTPTLEEYDPKTNKWEIKAQMSVPRSYFQAVVINNKIYVIGGQSTTAKNESSVEEYDPVTNKWTAKAPMSKPRCSLSAVVLNGKIYAIGGGDNGFLSILEEFDPITNKWTTKSPMAEIKAEFGFAVINEKLYIFGGMINNNSYSTSVDEFDPISNKWTSKESMSTCRRLHQIININETIYAIGGMTPKNSLSTVEVYHSDKNKWENIPSMAEPRTLFQTEAINGNIYAIGGVKDNGDIISTVEAYTPAQTDPTLTVTANPNKVKVGDTFTTDVAIHNVNNIYAEDIKINYDSNLFEYTGVQAKDGIKVYKEDKSAPGTVRFILASLGKDNAANGDKGLITLQFKAKSPGTGKVDIVKGRIADNSTLEMDVAEANCGEDTITVEGMKDVNRSGAFTLLDLGIDAGYYGMDASQTDSTKFDADVAPDGKIDDKDLTSITESILANMDYQPNNKG